LTSKARSRTGHRADLAFTAIVRQDADELSDLFERNADSVSRTFDPFPLTRSSARRIALQPRSDAFYIARLSGSAAAMSMLRGFDEGYDVPSFGVFVDSALQGYGIGRRFTIWTIEQAWIMNCPAVRLSVYGDNARARSLYNDLGFIELESSLVRRGSDQIEKVVMKLERHA
jgi:GNAT superfamily N-acetyltransferase